MSDCLTCGRKAYQAEWCSPKECEGCNRAVAACVCPPRNGYPVGDQGRSPLHYDGIEIAEAVPRRSSWRPVDITPVLEGTYRRAEPTVGSRDDGKGLFYPGRIHTVAAEAEGGKTWFALAACAEELTAGNACLYVDFEDDEGGIVGRLMSLGAPIPAIRERFVYVRPDEAVDIFAGRADLAEAISDVKPSLAILDGVTEAMSMHGLELKDNTDIAKFGKILPRWIAAQGPAVVALDHVVKDREGRGRYMLGGVHKLNAVNGAAYVLENRDPFGIGMDGRSAVLISKDRPGQLRRHGVKAHDSLFWYADLLLRSHSEDFTEASLPAPTEHGGVFRPTAIMARISKVLEAAPAGLSKNAIEGAVTGKATTIRYALETLIGEAYVKVERRGPSSIHHLVRPFTDE